MRKMRTAFVLILGIARLAITNAVTYSLNMYRLSAPSLSGDAYGYTLTSSSTQLYSGASSISGNTYSVYSSAVQWYKEPTAVSSTASLPTSFQSLSTSTYSSFYQLGPEVYRAAVTTAKPYVVYFGGPSGSEWMCASTTIALHAGFSCTLQSNAATTVATFSAPVQGTLWTLSADILVSGAANSLMGLMCHLTNQLQAESDSLDTIRTAAADRRSNGQDISVVFYLFGSLGFLGGTVASVVCAMWLWQPLGKAAAMADPANEALRTKMRLMNLGLWGGLHALAIIITMSAGQFPGLFVLGAILLVFLIGVSVSYPILQCYRSRTQAKVHAAGASEGCIPKEDIPPCASIEMGPQEGAIEPKQDPENSEEVHAAQQAHEERAIVFVPETCPHVLRHRGLRLAYVVGMVTMVLLIIVDLIVFFGWTAKEYFVFSRENNVKELEYQPGFVAKSLLLMYSWDSLATDLNYNVFAEIATSYCRDKYRASLSDKEVIKTDFIDKYSIDMTQYSPSDYNLYDSVNAWFIRGLAAGARPISTTANVIVSPADARLIVFTNIDPTARFWIKSTRVNYASLLDDDSTGSTFTAGTLAIYRLAPQDYHRFHSPVAGTITSIKSVGGTLFSVSADAAKSKNAAFLNQRQVVIINSATHGTVGFVAIGATCVGSVIMTKSVGDTLALGDELGYMQFGSTVVLLFQTGQVTFDGDLVYNSAQQVETHVLMGTRNAT